MKGLFRRSTTHLSRHSFTGRLILTACAVVVVTILAVGFASYGLYRSSFDREIMSFHMEVLSHVKKRFEASVLSDAKKTVDSLMIEKTQRNSIFALLPPSPATRDILDVYGLLSGKTSVAHALVDSLNVYGIKNGTMVSSRYGVHYTDASNRSGWVRDMEWMPDFLASQKREAWLPMRRLANDKNLGASEKNVLTYVRILAYEKDEPLGLVWINIDERQLQEQLMDITTYGYGDLYIISGDGYIASCADAGRLYESVAEEEWFMAMAQGVETQMMDIGGRETVISALRSDYTDLYYVYMSDSAQYYQKSALLSRTIGIICVVIMVVGVMLWLLLSRRMTKPFSQMVQRAYDLQVTDRHASPEGDLSLIGHTLDTLYTRSEDLARTLEENRGIMTNALLAELLRGHFSDVQEIASRLALSDIHFTKTHFTVLVMQPALHSPADAQALRETEYMMAHIHQYLRIHFPMALPVQLDGERHALLVNTAEDSQAYCEGLVAAISLYVQEEFAVPICFGLGDSVDSLGQVPRSCAQACEAIQYHVLEPQTVLWRYDRVCMRHADDMKLVEYVQTCMRALRNGGDGALEAVRAMHTLLSETASVANFHAVRSLMADAIVAVYKSLGISEHSLVGTAGPDTLRSIRYLPLLTTELEGICRALAAFHRERYADAGGQYVEKAQQYIQAHYDEAIQLESMAARLYISAPYLSRIFKKMTGENFIEYLTRVRMENARRLIEEDLLSVAQVAEKVGFIDIHYFKRKYKSFYGSTKAQK